MTPPKEGQSDRRIRQGVWVVTVIHQRFLGQAQRLLHLGTGGPPLRPAHPVGPGTQHLRERIAGVHGNGSFKNRHRLGVLEPRRAAHHLGQRAQAQVIRVQVGRRLGPRTLHLGQPKLGFDGRDHIAGDAVLQLEEVVELPLEAVAPHMPASRGFDQLRADAQALPGLVKAALEHIANAQLAPHPFDVDRPALVGKTRTARDDKERPHARQRRDDVVDHAVDKIVLPRVAAQVGKGQHRERGLVGQRQRRLVRDRGRVRSWRIGGLGQRRREAVAEARHGADGARPEQLAQRGDLHREVVLLHHPAGPHTLQQLFLAHHAVALFDQAHQHVEGARTQRHRLAVRQDLALVGANLDVGK